jgi:diguanylate cyclase (GGDEF)-like protein
VRKAFDALTDAVLVLDPDGKVMLANRSFRGLHPDADGVLHGRPVDELHWLWPPGAAEPAPWTRTLQEGSSVNGQALTIEQPDGPPLHAIVGCAAILDAGGRARGCLVTIDDVTQIHRTNDELRRTLVELEASREQIEAQNVELHQLATRDPLTGCLNRRALFEQAAALFAAAPGAGLCCVMVDIDHFKRFNDQFGHAIGDEVIKAVARGLGRGLRASDVLGRYGGEEFCILMPDTPIVVANDVAQRLRIAIMTHAASSTRLPDLPAITSSLGLASTSQGACDLQQLVARADASLYKSKQAGRNRVTLWRPDIATVAESEHA